MSGLFSLIHLLVLFTFFLLAICFGFAAIDMQTRNQLIALLVSHPLKLLIPACFFFSLSLILSLLTIHAHKGRRILLKSSSTTLSLSLIEEIVAPWIKEQSHEKLTLEKCSQYGGKLCLHVKGDLASINSSIESQLSAFLKKMGYTNEFLIELVSG